MKILHLSTHDNFGGAARAAYRQHLALRSQGVDSRMLVRYKHTDDPMVTVFSGNRSLTSRILRSLKRSWISLLGKWARKHGGNGICGLTDPRADLLCGITEQIAEADVINIHKIEYFVDLPALLVELPASKPVVITLHDVGPITGGCDYPGSCCRFEKSCGCCPILKSNSVKDYSHQIFRMQQAAYSTRLPENFAFVANSRWTGKKAKQSALAKGKRIEIIHLCLDQTVYSSEKRQEARRALGIGLDEKVLFFAAHDLSLEHKGGRCLREALKVLSFQTPTRLLTMGAGHFKAGSQYLHTHFGRVESDHLQALLYRAADVFVIPSLEEAFGQTALEAVACGTVVAGFNVGGITDVVQNGLNGLLVERGNVQALAQAIMQLLNNHDLKSRWQQSSEGWVRDRFSYSKNAISYIKLYRSLLKL